MALMGTSIAIKLRANLLLEQGLQSHKTGLKSLLLGKNTPVTSFSSLSPYPLSLSL